jgi:PAS domain S-box-containing protein
MVIILFLVVTVFELALYFLHLVIDRMDRVIDRQKSELENYSRQLEELVADQITKIRRVMTQFQAITDNIPIVFMVLDREGRITFSDGSGWSRLGIKAKEMLGKKASDIMPNQEIVACIERALGGERLVATHLIDESWFSTHYAPLKDESAKPAGAIIVAVDVTSEHEAAKPKVKPVAKKKSV